MSEKILVIDDEESIRFTFESFLADEGYAVVAAKDYEEALDRIAETEFDLIFADILLGGKSGIDVLREVRKRRMSCPVVMLTGYPNLETASEAVRLGAYDYMQKPVNQKTLLRVVKMALQHKALTDEKEQYRANLEAIFRSVKDAIITVDKGLTVLEKNAAAEKICGLSTDAVGKNLNSLIEGCNGKCLEALETTLRGKESVELSRLECHRQNRPRQIVTVNTSPLLDSQGDFSGAVMVVRDESRLHALECDLKERTQFHNIIGRSRRMQEIYSLLEKLADVPTTVLITGESGTGKELVAEALHYKGVRRDKPLVKVNCAALSENLLETELFGHVRGAFSGAIKDNDGRFQKADGGTIFLDEIGDISPRMQVRLLRVLQEKVIEKVGDSTPIKVDVRVVAATHQDLVKKIRRGEFREDLFYRLKVVNVALPPLRDQRQDIPLLVEHLIEKFNKKLSRHITGISAEVQKIFMTYDWPGNVRELEHALEHAFILCPHSVIAVDHLPSDLTKDIPSKNSLHSDIGENQVQSIRQALEKTDWNKAKAARLLGISRRTIYRKIQEHQISRD